MLELKEIVDLVGSTGIPLLITLLIIYGIAKYVPEALAVWREERKYQKQYYADRQKQCDDQMQALIRIEEQSSAVISHNTSAMERNTELHRATIDSYEKLMWSVQALVEEMKSRPCIKDRHN